MRVRGKSSLRKGRVGYLTPERIITYNTVAAPGAVGAIIFEAEAPGRLVRLRERHATAGAAASVILLHRHAAGTIAAPAAAVAAGIVLAASIPADTTANTWQTTTFAALQNTFVAGDTFMLIFPITVAGLAVQLTYLYSGHPVGATTP